MHILIMVGICVGLMFFSMIKAYITDEDGFAIAAIIFAAFAIILVVVADIVPEKSGEITFVTQKEMFPIIQTGGEYFTEQDDMIVVRIDKKYNDSRVVVVNKDLVEVTEEVNVVPSVTITSKKVTLRKQLGPLYADETRTIPVNIAIEIPTK